MEQIKPDGIYLKSLIDQTMQPFDEAELPTDDLTADLSAADIAHMPTRNRFWIGLKVGLRELSQRKKYKLKESGKLRVGCGSYVKIYKVGGEIVRIDQYSRNVPKESYFAVRHSDVRYLIPFMDGKKAFWTYIFATHFVEDKCSKNIW